MARIARALARLNGSADRNGPGRAPPRSNGTRSAVRGTGPDRDARALRRAYSAPPLGEPDRTGTRERGSACGHPPNGPADRPPNGPADRPPNGPADRPPNGQAEARRIRLAREIARGRSALTHARRIRLAREIARGRSALVLQRHPNGPRLWVFGQRVHHGASAIVIALALGAFRRRNAAICALVLAAHDRRDWRAWFAREIYSPDACLEQDESGYN